MRSIRTRAAASTPVSSGALVHSYLFLRRAIGVIGLGLPVVLIVGKILLDGGGTLGSISDYYYSTMRGVLVGSLAATGVFLLAYRGYGLVDDIVGDVAAVGAIGVALFPTTPFFGTPSPTAQAVGVVHLVSAGLFFAGLVVFSLFLFTRSSGGPTRQKSRRNIVYVASGLTMIVSLILVGVVDAVPALSTMPEHWVLWLETIAIEAFGVSWMVKGQTLLADQH